MPPASAYSRPEYTVGTASRAGLRRLSETPLVAPGRPISATIADYMGATHPGFALFCRPQDICQQLDYLVALALLPGTHCDFGVAAAVAMKLRHSAIEETANRGGLLQPAVCRA